MHSSISWQHCLINAKLKLCATIKCMAELQKLPHQQGQHPEEETRRAHIYCADIKQFEFLCTNLPSIYLLKAHTKRKKNPGISYDLERLNFAFES